jgi:TRAP transporter TAXI family solute receptor
MSVIFRATTPLTHLTTIITCIGMLCVGSPFAKASDAAAREILRIGTGGAAGTYFPIGSLIATAVNKDAQTQQTDQVNEPALLMVAQRSTGSQANLSDLRKGRLEAALAQADVVHWAYNAAGPFSGMTAVKDLRMVATLYSESIHLVVHKNSGIKSIADLAGRRVSVDEPGSGTRLNVPYILDAYGMDASQLQTVFLKPVDAMDRLRRNQLDAFFIVAGYPVSGIAALVEDAVANVLPISGPGVGALLKQFPFFTTHQIPADTYANAEAITTVAVPAQLIVNASLDEHLVYRITESLWHPETLSMLSNGHPRGKDVQFNLAIDGLSVPLHPGAERYYRNKAHAYFSQ